MAENQEIEARFLDIDAEKLKKKLISLGAEDHGEEMLEEIIFYDNDFIWSKENKFIRLRKKKEKITLAYKHFIADTIDGNEDIEFEISDMGKARLVLERTGLVAFRQQQKKRHTFVLDGVTVDFDTWPTIPTYVEIEGDSEYEIRSLAEKIALDWSKAVFENAGTIIGRYGIKVQLTRIFTFSKIE